ncbi:MAG: hypothetical protein LBD45_06485 [Bacteroidales bacterium]|jgi:hypothetical protein|nr:hypothetical protein [Bacteroidales bacterium]
MKPKRTVKILVTITGIALLAACSNRSEYAYNETAASLYYHVSKDFEYYYTQFQQGEIKTKHERGEKEFDFGSGKAEQLKNVVAGSQQTLALLKPSKKAEAFHQKLNDYFQLVGNDFVNLLQTYLDLNCDCPEQKDSLNQEIHNLYKRISLLEDQCLEEQKKYIESVGGQPK